MVSVFIEEKVFVLFQYCEACLRARAAKCGRGKLSKTIACAFKRMENSLNPKGNPHPRREKIGPEASRAGCAPSHARASDAMVTRDF